MLLLSVSAKCFNVPSIHMARHLRVLGLNQIRKIAGCTWVENLFLPPLVSNPDMRHVTCVTHVPWCMLGSLTSGFLWSQWRWKRSRHFMWKCNPQFTCLVRGPQKISIWSIFLMSKANILRIENRTGTTVATYASHIVVTFSWIYLLYFALRSEL